MPRLLMGGPASKVGVENYPQEKRFVGWGTGASITTHIIFVLVIFIIAWLNHIKNLRDFMRGQTAQPPPPQNEIEIILPPDETPPPPTDHPEFIRQIVQIPKPPPPPLIKPKPVPKPPTPHLVVHNKAVVKSNSQSLAPARQLVIGSGNLPQPQYPAEAERSRIQGTVVVTVVFDSSGGIVSCDIVQSSGSSVLDTNTRRFIENNWHEPADANLTLTGPVHYVLP